MRPLLIGLFALTWAAGACAGYANLSPPPNWSAGTGTDRGMFRAAANESWALDRTVRTTATLNVGGRPVTMPAGFRMAANAGRFAARFAWANPVLFAVGAVAVPLLVDWLSQNKYYWNDSDKRWEKMTTGTVCTSGCKEYRKADGVTWTVSLSTACATYNVAGGMSSSFVAVTGIDTCTMRRADGLEYTQTVPMRDTGPYDTSTRGPASQTGMENDLAAVPLPANVANEGAPKGLTIPVGDPVLNPSPLFVPETLRVPVGEPYPVPNTNPQKYQQPVLDLKPAPTTLEPWRVDAKPLDVTSEDPDGVDVPESVPEGGTSTAVVTPKETLDLCAANPDILACQSLGTPPDAVAVGTREVAVSMTPASGWQLAASSCPADRVVTIGGTSQTFSLQMLCDFATGIRPIVVGMAYLSAMLAFFGIARKAT